MGTCICKNVAMVKQKVKGKKMMDFLSCIRNSSPQVFGSPLLSADSSTSVWPLTHAAC